MAKKIEYDKYCPSCGEGLHFKDLYVKCESCNKILCKHCNARVERSYIAGKDLCEDCKKEAMQK